MRKLQIAQCFENIQTTYDQPSITWKQECAEFSLNGNDPTSGQLTVWEDGVAPEQIFTSIDGLERKINQFLLAMQVMDNARMRKKDESAIKYYSKDGHEFEISTSFPEIVDIILKHEGGEPWCYVLGCLPKMTRGCSITSSPVSLPSILPQVSLKLADLIGIFTSAENFSGPFFVDHQLGQYCKILEELMHKGHIKEPDLKNNDVWKARNFISHARCDQNKTRNFIIEEFPEAMDKDKKYAKFDRTKNSHINFIWKYRDQAHEWVKRELAHLSNPDNNF
jgi:hypothetical protein